MKNFKLVSAAAASLMATTALAQDLPQQDFLTTLIAGTTPPFWSVSDLEVVATSRGGNAALPLAQIRFEADAAPGAALFAEASREGPFVVVAPTEAKGNVRRLYGYFDLAYSAGKWDGDVVIENPVDAFGQPRDLFDAPTLVLGSEDTDTRLAALRENDIAGAIARHETEMSNLANESHRALAALEAEQTQAITQARAKQAEELAKATISAEKALADARAAAERRLAAAKRDYETRLSELTTEQKPLVAAAEAERAEIIAEEKAKTEAALTAIREQASTELEKLRAEHAARRGKLIETQRQEQAELETRLATERQSLQRQLVTAQDTIELQQELLAAMESRAAGADQVLAAFNEARETRRAFFARMPRDWTGQVVCRTEDGSYNNTWPLSLSLEQATTTGFTGSMSDGKEFPRPRKSGSRDTSLTANGDSMALPMTMRLESDGQRNSILAFLNAYDVTITPDGLILGAVDRPVTVDNITKVATCNVRLGVRDS